MRNADWHRGRVAVSIAGAAPARPTSRPGVDAWSRGDYRRARSREWREPAVAGDADAQFNLGQAYKLGRGVPVDPALAESWFRKAALQGHPQAEDNYGLALFQEGKQERSRCRGSKSRSRAASRARSSCSARCCSTATACRATICAPMR